MITSATKVVTVDASGDAVDYSPSLTGILLQILYDKIDYADGVDLNFKHGVTDVNIWAKSNVNASANFYPTITLEGVGSTGLIYQAVTSDIVPGRMAFAGQKIKITIDEGGVSTSGRFVFILEN